MTAVVSAVLLVPPDSDRLGWLKAATRYAQRKGLRIDAVTSDPGTAAKLHAGGWTVLASVWQTRLDPFRVVDIDRPPDDTGRARRISPTSSQRRPRWTGKVIE